MKRYLHDFIDSIAAVFAFLFGAAFLLGAAVSMDTMPLAIVFLVFAISSFTVGYFLANGPKRRKKRTAAATKAQDFDQVSSILEQSLRTHIQALCSQYRKLVRSDPYGNILREPWENEIEYFQSTTIDPLLSTELRFNAALHLWSVTNPRTQTQCVQLYGVERAPFAYFNTYIKACIETAVEDALAGFNSANTTSVDEMDPAEFEQLCANMLERAGWDARVVAGSGDQGVDIVANHGDTTAVFQCKRYSKPLGNTPVQEIFTGKQFYDAQLAAVITNSSYTAGAQAAAEQTGVRLLHFSELERFQP